MQNASDETHSSDSQPAVQKSGFFRSASFLGLLAGLVVLSFAGLIYSLYVLSAPPPTERLESAFKILQKGDSQTAALIAEGIDDAVLSKPEIAQKHLLLGIQARDAASKADQLSKAYAMTEQSLAHLQKSQSNRFPNGYEGLGNYYLGLALFDLFRWQEAEKSLEIATERWPQGRSDAIERLVDIDLSAERNDVSAAMKRIAHWRKLPSSSPEDSVRADVKEMQALLKAGDHQSVIKKLETITPDAKQLPQAQLLAALARRNLYESTPDKSDREKLLIDALELIASILKSPHASLELRRKASLEQGNVLKLLGKLPDAISAFGVLRMASPQTPEGLAAGVHEIETLIDAGRVDETPVTMRQISSSIGDLKWYRTDWLSIPNLRDRLLGVGKELIAGDHFSQAEGFIDALPSFAEETEKTLLESNLYEKWAKSLPIDSETRPQRLKLYRSAAHAYERLLDNLGRSTDYNDWLWNAISNYQNAELYQDSNRLIDRYLNLESRENRPKGHFARAQNLKALSKLDEAMTSLESILDTAAPSLLIYDARLELAKIKASKNQYDEALALLRDCMNGEIRPETALWQESLRLAAQLTYEQAEKVAFEAKEAVERNPSQLLQRASELALSHQKALESIGMLEEFQLRYPAAPERFDNQYRLARAYELATYWPRKQWQEGIATTPTELVELEQQADRMHSQAAETYASLRHELMQHESSPTSPHLSPKVPSHQNISHENILRNSLFGEAGLHFEKEAYSKASEVYSEAASRYRKMPEELEARKQLAICQRKQGLDEASIRTIQQALDTLDAIPASEDSRFVQVTSHDRQGWQRYLQSLLDLWRSQDRKQ